MDIEKAWENRKEWDEEERYPQDQADYDEMQEMIEDLNNKIEILRASNEHYIRRCCELQEEIRKLKRNRIARFFQAFRSDIRKRVGI